MRSAKHIYFCRCENVIGLGPIAWRCGFKGYVVVTDERHEFGGVLCPQCGAKVFSKKVKWLNVTSKEV